jgi:hypothetical protein
MLLHFFHSDTNSNSPNQRSAVIERCLNQTVRIRRILGLESCRITGNSDPFDRWFARIGA